MADAGLAGTVPVAERLRFDEEGLGRFIDEYVGAYEGTLAVAQFAGGQSNPTYLVNAGGTRYVLRRKPPGRLLPSAHQIEREFEVLLALARSVVPVPAVYALCLDASVIGTPFYLMEYVPGRVFRDRTLPGLAPEERGAIIAEACRISADLHRIEYAGVGLQEFGRPGGYLRRQIERWARQYRESSREPNAAMERLAEFLNEHCPAESGGAIVHGDYHLGNLLIHPMEPRVAAVLDWELATLGDPLADFARLVMYWRIPVELGGMAGMDETAMGIPSEEECVTIYAGRSGRDELPNWEYYVIFNLFRLAAIREGISARAQGGNATDANAATVGATAPALAEIGWREAQRAMQMSARLGG